MSASIYRALKWCTLNSDEITQVVNNIVTGFIYKAQDFYDEVEKLGAWRPATEEDDSVCIWNTDDAGPISDDNQEVGLIVHYDEDAKKFDWACTYQIHYEYEDLTEEEIRNLPEV